ncbi:sugar transferase [Paludibacterium purpuratum]|uniref:Lipopolysaccharide/colanic/teichoic acid biosynthesis glycosyltransferase n=1 Tax=Paludibacterium purpuratum TaxID=1144873 RepID=A0A4V3DUT3_9NEIS|nr:sugar transferase [Paludibacterium purpuratum]TDR76737.1 lipopolysaccharide/colanic/teichoic acid biosynthesis glycosyltransferase [Paludibacterium purpuratum]
MQRLFDVLLSGMALLILMPLLLPVCFILLLTGEHEVFFKQKRIGKDGREFFLYKFATMLKNSPALGHGTITVKGDPRILPVGKFLRKTKLNELPQLLNILLGEMSVVGPRPLTPQTFSAYPLAIQQVVVKVKPGLSGIGSVVFRAEEDMLSREDASVFYAGVVAPYKGALEEWFVSHRSLRSYFLLIMITAWVVLFPRSALVWRFFPSLPLPPDQLKPLLNYPT